MSTHHFLIHDHDSQTNFTLSQLPVKFACGYKFCDHEEPSTLSEISEASEKDQKNNSFPKKQLSHAKDDNSNQKRLKQDKVYHESAIRKHIAKMESAYTEHKIDVAWNESRKLKSLCQKTNHKLTSVERKFVDQIEREMIDVQANERILSQEGWQLKKEKTNIRVSSKIEGNTVGVLVEAFLDAPIQNFLSILTQIDLMKKWMPFMKTSSLEKIVSRNCRIGHCINNFPILSNRQSFFQGIGYDRMQHNQTVFMYTRSLNERKDLQRQLDYQVHETEDAVQLDYKYLIIEYKPDTPTTGILKLAINVDMKLRIPMLLLEPGTIGFGIDFYSNVLQITKNFKGSQWQKKVEENPAFFDFVQKRIREYFKASKM